MKQMKASDGTPLENHYQVIIAEKQFVESFNNSPECLDDIDKLITKAAELNFSDKNVLNQNLFSLYQDQQTLGKMLISHETLSAEVFLEKYRTNYLDLLKNCIQTSLFVNCYNKTAETAFDYRMLKNS